MPLTEPERDLPARLRDQVSRYYLQTALSVKDEMLAAANEIERLRELAERGLQAAHRSQYWVAEETGRTTRKGGNWGCSGCEYRYFDAYGDAGQARAGIAHAAHVAAILDGAP